MNKVPIDFILVALAIFAIVKIARENLADAEDSEIADEFEETTSFFF